MAERLGIDSKLAPRSSVRRRVRDDGLDARPPGDDGFSGLPPELHP